MALSCQLFLKMGKNSEEKFRNCVFPISIRLTIINIAGLSFSQAPLPSVDVT